MQKKSKKEPLDYYLNLKFSLQGLLLIYNKAYVLLSKDRELSVKEVIDEIYKAIKKSELKKDLGEMADDRKLDTFNTLINPRGEKVLKTEKDFEDQIIKDVKDVLETSIAFLIIVQTGHRKAESTARRKDSNRGLALFFIANQ